MGKVVKFPAPANGKWRWATEADVEARIARETAELDAKYEAMFQRVSKAIDKSIQEIKDKYGVR